MHREWLYALSMVRFTVLASGSKGNSTVVSGGQTRILVDAGLSCRELFRRMRLAGEDPETLDAIIVTHEHQDHIGGVAVTARKLGIPVYFTEATHRAWMRWITPRRQMTYAQWMAQCREQEAARQAEASVVVDECGCDDADGEESDGVMSMAASAAGSEEEAAYGTGNLKSDSKSTNEGTSAAAVTQWVAAKREGPKLDPAWLPSVGYFKAGQSFQIGDIAVSPFTIPHDAIDPVGFVFQAEGVRMALATDLGYIPPNVKAQLKRVDLLMLESNHDLEMLRDGPYPWQIKQRVLSRVGHLSNDAAADFLEAGYDGQATYVILGHISESNNLPDLARVTAERALVNHASLLANRLVLAGQHEPLAPISF